MAITHVGTETAVATGTGDVVTSITVDYPSGLASGDVIHAVAYLTRPRWTTLRGTSFALARAYSYSPPPGWTIVYSAGPLMMAQFPHAIVLRRIASGAESGSVTIPIARQNPAPDVPEQPYEVLMATAAITAHRGATPFIFEGPFTRGMWGIESTSGGASTGTTQSVNSFPQSRFEDSMLLQFALYTRIDKDDPGDPVPAVSNPLVPPSHPVFGNPSWDVLGQESALTTSMSLVLTPTTMLNDVGSRIAVLETFDPTVGQQQLYGDPAWAAPSDWLTGICVVLVDISQGGAVDAPPAPGQVGVTGSGWILPEWVGRERQVLTPLACSVWTEGTGDYGPELVEVMNEFDGLRPVGLDVTFNGLGAITSGVATFAAPTGLVPFRHYLAFHLRTPDLLPDAPAVAWAGGLVRNVRFDGGLWEAELTGLWSILNDARITVDSADLVERPSLPGVIEDTLVLGIGDPSASPLEAASDWQQSWGTYLNNIFRDTPQAAWGIGPDRVYIQGLPEQGGVWDLGTEHFAVAQLDAGGFILPPFATEWWATDATDSDVIVSATVSPPPGLLTPNRIAQSRVDLNGALVMPKEAFSPTVAGPSHTLAFAGLAVPPLRIINLPGGVTQMVASARVQISVGEEGSMPSIVTTLTTVALPYGGA